MQDCMPLAMIERFSDLDSEPRYHLSVSAVHFVTCKVQRFDLI